MSLYQEPAPAVGNLTQAVDILAFVEAQEIPPDYFETPYFLAPVPGGERDYALLRETLRRTRKIGIAYVVIQARQHLAALIPHGQSLVLNTLRWNREDRKLARDDNPVQDIRPSFDRLPSLTSPPLHQMRVTGCDGIREQEEEEEDEDEDLLMSGRFSSDDLRRALLRPRLHGPAVSAGRSRIRHAMSVPGGARRVTRRT